MAAVALMKAVDRFDPEQGVEFRLRHPHVIGELKRHFRDRAGRYGPRGWSRSSTTSWDDRWSC